MKLRSLIVCFSVTGVFGVAPVASAQDLALRIENGLVTLEANNVTVDEILARWTAATGLNVVSKSGVGSDMPVTLKLSGVSEREALQTVLRDLSGYIMGERRDPLTGVVTIDRLLILPQSAAQAPTSPAPRLAPAGRRSPFTRGMPTPPVVAETFVAPPVEPDDTPVELAPAPGRSGSPPAGRLIGNGPGAMLDFTGGEPNVDPGLEASPAPAASPSPFGNSRGASRPGEMTPAPPEVAPQVIQSITSGGRAGPGTMPLPPSPEATPER